MILKIPGVSMEERLSQIKALYKAEFGKDLQEHDLYGYLFPRLIKQMDSFLDEQISTKETLRLTTYLSEKLHGKAKMDAPAGNDEAEEIPRIVASKPKKKKEQA